MTAEEIKNLLRQWELYKKDHWWDSTAINVEAVLMKEFAEAYTAQQSKIPTEDVAIRNFFIWMVRKANIDVIDAENAIEVHSLREPSTGLVPVVSIDELIKMYRKQITG